MQQIYNKKEDKFADKFARFDAGYGALYSRL